MSEEGRRKPTRENAPYQLRRRRFTAAPSYMGVLPRVFPFRVRLDQERSTHFICDLLDAEKNGFALTSHPSTVDGHVWLWLSVDCAEYLMDTLHVISPNQLEGIED